MPRRCGFVTANIRNVARYLKNDPDRRMTNVVQGAYVGDLAMWPESELAKLDLANVAWWATELRAAEASIRRLRKRLLKLASPDAAAPMSCEECEGPMSGRSDRRFCSAACRQRAYRSRDGS